MRIIVEGPDGAGKTTLVEKLEDALDMTKQPRAVDKQAKHIVALDEWVDNDLKTETKDFVRLYDRHAIISGPIYSPILHSGFMAFPWDMSDWAKGATRQFWSQDNAIIFCLPDAHVVLGNVERTITEQPEALRSLHAFHQMYWSYWNLAHHLVLNQANPFMYIYNYTKAGSMELLVSHLVDVAQPFGRA